MSSSAVVPIAAAHATPADGAEQGAAGTPKDTGSLLRMHTRTVLTTFALGLVFGAATIPVAAINTMTFNAIQTAREDDPLDDPREPIVYDEFDWRTGQADVQRVGVLLLLFILVPLGPMRVYYYVLGRMPPGRLVVASVLLAVVPPLFALLDRSPSRGAYILSIGVSGGAYWLALRSWGGHPLVRTMYSAGMAAFMWCALVVWVVFPVLMGGSSAAVVLWTRVLGFPVLTDLSSAAVRTVLIDATKTSMPLTVVLTTDVFMRVLAATAGRMAIFSIGDTQTRLWCVVGVSLVEMLLRVTMPYRKQLAARLRGRREQPPDDSRRVIVAAQVLADEFAETVGTMATAATFIAMRMSRDRVAPAASGIMLSALLQLGVELVVDLLLPLLLLLRRGSGAEGDGGPFGSMRRRVLMHARAQRLWLTDPRRVALGLFVYACVALALLLVFGAVMSPWRTFVCVWSKRNGWWHYVPCDVVEGWL